MRRESITILTVSLCLCSFPAWAQTQLNACDLMSQGTVNQTDVTAAINMSIGAQTCPSSINVFGPGVCNAVVVQRVINASLGQPCVVGTHSVVVSWSASTPGTYAISGYNVYRSTTTSNYVQINPSLVTTGLSFTDGAVSNSTTYYYVVKAVDTQNNQSAYSTAAPATIPSS